ncbi:MAG: M67 family metallopeptidase [Nitrospirae bacterium]|nr:M67 family metallopeptidase [Nitrospirota bacterium]
MADTISIPAGLLNEIIAHCKEVYPNEACGILAGKGNDIERAYKITNIKNSPVIYEMEPVEQLRCEKDIRNARLKIICLYHSHPSSSAHLSQADVAKAYWQGEPDMPIYPDACYMIIGPVDGNLEVRVFKLSGQKINEVKLDII